MQQRGAGGTAGALCMRADTRMEMCGTRVGHRATAPFSSPRRGSPHHYYRQPTPLLQPRHRSQALAEAVRLRIGHAVGDADAEPVKKSVRRGVQRMRRRGADGAVRTAPALWCGR